MKNILEKTLTRRGAVSLAAAGMLCGIGNNMLGCAAPGQSPAGQGGDFVSPDRVDSKSTSSIEVETPYTLFVDNVERRVWYLASWWGKDEDAEVYVFENGAVTRYGSSSIDLTMGDIAKSTDDEVIDYCKANAGSSKASEVALHLISDNTGNNVEREHVKGVGHEDFDRNLEYGFYYLYSPMNNSRPIYDSQFAGYEIYTTSGHSGYFVTKVDGSTAFALDNLSDYDIPVD
ncbi:hypothetical protein [Eggerthella sinensis]|uniref:hypothetical protein n=1 Tax=Eggerthella sinensis TaxID=242230 RepID=UPI00266C3F97|nr:hypothetical protein [Eggerthella sinensis]